MRLLREFLARLGHYFSRWFKPDTAATVSADSDPDADCRAHRLQFTGRRKFLHRLSITLGGVATALVGIPFVGFIFFSRRVAPETTWRAIGSLDDFPIGETRKATFIDPTPLPWAGFSARTAAWVRREATDEFVAYSAYCTHVGCPVRWLADAELFLCPCHGGSCYPDGAVAGGPPRQALDQYAVRVRDGQVEILAAPQPLPA